MQRGEVAAIDPVRTDTRKSLHWIFRRARYQLNCGVCHTRFQASRRFGSSRTVCPSCGVVNILWIPDSPKSRRR